MLTSAMLRFALVVLFAGLVARGQVGRIAAAQADVPVVRVILFWMDSCRHCHQVIEQTLPPLKQRYGDQLDIQLAEIRTVEDWDRLEAIAVDFDIEPGRLGTPLLLIGGQALIGSDEIGRRLPSLIDDYLARGGVDLPTRASWPETTPFVLPGAPEPSVQGSGAVRVVYFYSTSCSHCMAVLQEVLLPLQAKYGERLEFMWLELGVPANYELLVRAESTLGGSDDRRLIPVLVIGDQVLVGEAEVRQRLEGLIVAAFERGGQDWPAIPGLDKAQARGPGMLSPSPAPPPAAGLGSRLGPSLQAEPTAEAGCSIDQTDACASAAPVWAAYFYQVGCQECSRARLDIEYVRSRYPRLMIEEFNVYDDLALAKWLSERAGRDDFHTPAVFIGQEALIGAELTAQNLLAAVEKYASVGAGKTWVDFDVAAGQSELLAGFRSLGPLTVVLAGLVDGLNPCAFATLVFFVSYLSLSGRKGREVLLVGGAFALGIFLAYLGVGLGFYKVLDLLGETLQTLGRWVYAFTAVLCAVLAVLAFRDYLRVRRGQMGDMSLKLPEFLRLRINAVIRRQRGARAYVAVAFVSGIVISFLELACTGQIYLPTIVFVASIPEMRLQAAAYLALYNLMFITPLIVVFVMAYYGTTSKQFSSFLQRRAGAVKLGMTAVFAALSGWLIVSLL